MKNEEKGRASSFFILHSNFELPRREMKVKMRNPSEAYRCLSQFFILRSAFCIQMEGGA
jgi:hypothetical protein